jgi:succinoglycan biosynthesis transport protein ExoP
MLPTPRPNSDVDFAPLGHFANESSGRTIDVVKFTVSIWKPLAIGLGGGLLLGILAYLYLGPTYQADTRILVSEKSSAVARPNSVNLVGDRGEHVTLIRSDAIVHRALNDHGLNQLPAFEGGDDPIQDIIDGLKVSRSAGRETSKDNIFDISYTHPDPETAPAVVDAIVSAYRDFLDDRQRSSVSSLTTDQATRERELREEIRELERQHYEWRESQPAIFRSAPIVTANGTAMVQQNRWEQEFDAASKRLLDNELLQTEVRSKLTALQDMLARDTPRDVVEFWIMNAMSSSSGGEGRGQSGGGGTSVLAGPPAKSSLDSQLLMVRMLEARLLQLVGPDHEDVLKIQRQIATILDFYRQQGITPPRMAPLVNSPDQQGLAVASSVDLPSLYGAHLESELKYLDGQHTALQAQADQKEQQAKQASLLEIEDNRFKDRIAESKKELEGLVRGRAEFDSSKDSEGYIVQSIAQVRVSTSLKRVLKVVGACGMLGMGLVFALAYFREWYDSTVRSVEEVRNAIGASALGVVPHLPQPQAAELAAAQASGVSPALWYYHSPGSAEAEAYRTIRTTLFAATKSSGDKVLQISSPEPGDGKSTTAANLAVALAQSGKKVLLIDADLRRPSIDGLFGLRRDVGLSEVLRREVQWEHALQATTIEGLVILTSGSCPSNPAELLSLATLPQLLREVRTDFDFILVDSPPVLAVSDPCIVAPHTDGMLLVVRLQKNKRVALQRAREILNTQGATLYGFIANDEPRSEDSATAARYGGYYVSQPAAHVPVESLAAQPVRPVPVPVPVTSSATQPGARQGFDAIRDRYANLRSS